MSRLLEKLKTSKMCLIASIPANNYELAKLAWEAGADAIKVHINVWHRASNNTFGSMDENLETFTRILKDSPVPVGIVLGEETFKAEENIDRAVEMGFDFVSLYGHHTPASLLTRKDIGHFYSVNYTYSDNEIKYISNSPYVKMLELSVCNPESYGERLNGRDIIKYYNIASNCNVPTIVPTQHVVYPSDVKLLYTTGVKAIMVGAISMGKEPQHIYETLKAFREEIDKL